MPHAHCSSSHTVLLHGGLPSSSQQVETAASPDVARLTTYSDTPAFGVRKEEVAVAAPLAALLLRGLLQRTLRGGGAFKPLGGDDGLMGHALPHHVPFSPQCDLLRRGGEGDEGW